MMKHQGFGASRKVQSSGFTLVELLVVIGIIAVLVGILVPTLARARAQAQQVACSSNMRQLATSMLMYINANRGLIPSTGALIQHTPYDFSWRQRETDWLYWAEFPARMTLAPFHQKEKTLFLPTEYTLANSPIAKYIATPFAAAVLKCPGDDGWRQRKSGNYPLYNYSYVLNDRLGTMYNTSDPERAYKITQIKRSQDKYMFFEEDEMTIDDPYGCPWFVAQGTGGYAEQTNLLAIRHDIRRPQREPLPAGNVYTTLPNPAQRGNVAFCDGSVRYLSRREFHRPGVCLPRWPEVKTSNFAMYGPK